MAEPNKTALSLWQERMALRFKGQDPRRPLTWVYDRLWQAACWEAHGVELRAQGADRAADECFEQAERILRSEGGG